MCVLIFLFGKQGDKGEILFFFEAFERAHVQDVSGMERWNL